jgi:methionyl-tRNA synthetase
MAKHLVTSALPYINGIKHLGNLVGSMLPSDVYARFLRQTGHDVLLICATDDHGTPAELAAAKAEQEPVDFCGEQHEVQKKIYEEFGLSFDYFGKTSHKHNIDITQHFYQQLDEHGFIEERSYEQIYSNADQRFLPDRYVEGECPHCGYDKARGDQCENCGKVLDPTDLVNPRSAISGSTDVEVRETKHLFLLQSKLADQIRSWVNGQKWSKLVKGIALKWLDEGLEDRCITRDLKWGVPVPRDGFENKVFYVWFDAPIGYMGATAEWADSTNNNWKDWWYNTDDVTYTQFMGKDNIPFHTISFPATLLGSNEPWKTVDVIKGFSWLTYYGGKFSTSQQIGVFTNQALDILPADYWRYYLMARVPESDDSAFTWPDFQSVINKDMADVLGNYINRLLTFSSKKFGNTVPASGAWTDAEEAFATEIQTLVNDYKTQMEALEFRKAMRALREIWTAGNNYLAAQAPWTAIKEDEVRAACILRTGINFIEILAQVSCPIVPFTAAKLAATTGVDENGWPADVKALLAADTSGNSFSVPPVLFQKLEDAQVATWAEQYGAPKEEAA